MIENERGDPIFEVASSCFDTLASITIPHRVGGDEPAGRIDFGRARFVYLIVTDEDIVRVSASDTEIPCGLDRHREGQRFKSAVDRSRGMPLQSCLPQAREDEGIEKGAARRERRPDRISRHAQTRGSLGSGGLRCWAARGVGAWRGPPRGVGALGLAPRGVPELPHDHRR